VVVAYIHVCMREQVLFLLGKHIDLYACFLLLTEYMLLSILDIGFSRF